MLLPYTPLEPGRAEKVPPTGRTLELPILVPLPSVKRLLLVVLLLAGSLAAAYGFFETRRDRNYRRLIDQGEAALAAGNTSAAIEAFSGAVALKSDSMLGYLRRGEAYRRRRDLDDALRDLLQASDLDPTAPRPLELLGDVNTSLLRYDRAGARYQAYLAIDDQSPRVLYKLGLVRYRAGEPAEGIPALRRALSLNPRFAEAHYVLGLCLRDLHQNAEALAALTRAVDLAPALLPAREELAELYGRLGRVDERLTQLEALAALDPGPSRSIALGLAYSRAGMTDRAVPTLKQAADRYPDVAYIQVALGRVWLEGAQARGDRAALAKALESLEGAVGNDDSSEALTLFGRALLLASDHELAERMLQDASTREPVDPFAFFYLAEAAERLDHPRIALQALLDFRTLTGEERDARRSVAMAERIGDLSMRAKDSKAAVMWYQRAVDAGGGADAALLVHLASAQADTGDRDAARVTVSKAIERDAGNIAARALARQLR
jgi:tetratricopeptide (TPR) repeat protein